MHTPCCTGLSLWATNTRGWCHRQMTITSLSTQNKEHFGRREVMNWDPARKRAHTGLPRYPSMTPEGNYFLYQEIQLVLRSANTDHPHGYPQAPAQSLHMYVIAAPISDSEKTTYLYVHQLMTEKTQSTHRRSIQQQQGLSMAHAPTWIAKMVKEEAKHKSHVCMTSTLQA